MLAFFAIGVVVLFFVLLRLGVLDQLPDLLGRRRSDQRDPEEARRLEVFKDFIDSEPEQDE